MKPLELQTTRKEAEALAALQELWDRFDGGFSWDKITVRRDSLQFAVQTALAAHQLSSQVVELERQNESQRQTIERQAFDLSVIADKNERLADKIDALFSPTTVKKENRS